MKLTYETTLADYRAAHNLYRRKMLLTQYSLILWIIAVLGCTYLVSLSKHQSGLFLLAKSSLVFSVFCSIIVIFGHFIYPNFGYRRNHNENYSSNLSTTEISSERIIDVMPSKQQTSYEWSEVTGFAQNSKVTLIDISGRFLFFPSLALNVEQRAELDQIVANHGIRRWS
jgi:hypothetical protein